MFQSSRARTAASGRRIPAPLRWAGNALAYLVLCSTVLAALALIVVPWATGSQAYTVLTSSMAPGYPPGTFIVVQPKDFAELEVGDVVTYQLHSGRPDVVTHRITAFTADQEGNRLLVTKGDNNDLVDEEPVMEVQVRGALLYAVPYVGWAANALGRADRAMPVTIAALALIGYGGISFLRGVKDRCPSAEDGEPGA